MAKMPAEFVRSRFQLNPYDGSRTPAPVRAVESKRGAAMREIERRNELRQLTKEMEL